MKLLVIDTSYNLDDIKKKKLYQAIYSRDLDGFFKKVWSVHPFANILTNSKLKNTFGKYKINRLNKNHIFIEGKFGRFKLLKFIPLINFMLSQIEILFYLKKIVIDEKINFIKSGDPLYNSILAYILSRMTKIPFIIRVSGNFDKIYKDTNLPIMKRMFFFRSIEKIIERFMFKKANYVVAPNRDNLNYAIKNGAKKNKTKIIRYGSLLFKNHLVAPKKRIDPYFFEKSLGINKKYKIIIYVGRLEEVKRVRDLIKIYKKINIKNLKLLVVGNGSLNKFLKEEIQKKKLLKNIILLGEKDQNWLSRCLPNCNCFIATHTGRALAEAAFAGIPVAGYNIDWHSEIIKNDRDGLLVNTGDTKKLASAIKKILNNKKLAKKFSLNIRLKAEKILSPSVIVKNEIEIFKKL